MFGLEPVVDHIVHCVSGTQCFGSRRSPAANTVIDTRPESGSVSV